MYDIAQVGLSRTNEFTQTRQPKRRLGVRAMLLYTYIRVWTAMLALFANALVYRAHGFYCIFFVFLWGPPAAPGNSRDLATPRTRRRKSATDILQPSGKHETYGFVSAKHYFSLFLGTGFAKSGNSFQVVFQIGSLAIVF